MPTYMFQESYTSEAWAVQIKNPKNRVEVARQIIEAQGGKLLSAYYAFGEDDVVLIAEFPDNVSAATGRFDGRRRRGGEDIQHHRADVRRGSTGSDAPRR